MAPLAARGQQDLKKSDFLRNCALNPHSLPVWAPWPPRFGMALLDFAWPPPAKKYMYLAGAPAPSENPRTARSATEYRHMAYKLGYNTIINLLHTILLSCTVSS